MPPGGAPANAARTPGGWSDRPFGGAAHKPGAVPLRPLSLGDVYDGAFKIIRFNPKATVGSAAAVAALAMTVPIIITVLTTLLTSHSGGSDARALGLGIGVFSILAGTLLLQVGLVLVTGMVAGVVREAALGRVVTLSAAWAHTSGRRWRLLGLLLMQAVIGLGVLAVYGVIAVVVAVSTHSTGYTVLWLVLAGLLLVLPAYAFVAVRLMSLSTPCLMLEDVGVFAALGRAYRLSQGQFWRLFGILLLTALVTGVVGGIIAAPFSIVGQVGLVGSATYGALIYVVATSIGSVVNAAFTTPFRGSVTTLLYLDQRMRKEGYDVELMAQAGLLER